MLLEPREIGRWCSIEEAVVPSVRFVFRARDSETGGVRCLCLPGLGGLRKRAEP